MKCLILTLSAVTSLAALAVSIVVPFCKAAPTGADSATILVETLSILVAILLGWQIYNAITLERRLSKLAKGEAITAANEVRLSICQSEYLRVLSLVESKRYTEVVVFASFVIQELDKLPCEDKEVQGLYKDCVAAIRTVYEMEDVDIAEIITVEVMKALKANTENSEDVLKLYVSLQNKVQSDK